MMLPDADSIGVFAYLDEAKFDRKNLTISTDYVSFLLARRRASIQNRELALPRVDGDGEVNKPAGTRTAASSGGSPADITP